MKSGNFLVRDYMFCHKRAKKSIMKNVDQLLVHPQLNNISYRE